MGMMEEMSASEKLRISVGDGPNTGQHYAERQSRGEWIAKVGREFWVISSDPKGYPTICIGRRTTSGKVCSPPPTFEVTFPGEPFGAKGDVVVTVA
jgi:hypothetical protein